MLRKTILIFLIISLLLCGCGINDNGNSDDSELSDSEADTEKSSILLSGISLEMSTDDFFKALEKLKLSVEIPDYNDFPLPEDIENPKEDGRIYNMTDYSFYYKVSGLELYFTFSEDGKLNTVSNRDKKVLSDKNLRIGCSLGDAKSIYGEIYTETPEEFSALQYDTDNGYFTIFYQNDTVIGWNLSLYSNVNND